MDILEELTQLWKELDDFQRDMVLKAVRYMARVDLQDPYAKQFIEAAAKCLVEGRGDE